MKEYDPDSKCPKCGGELISTRFRGSWIVRVCQRCGHEWNETPLDEVPKE